MRPKDTQDKVAPEAGALLAVDIGNTNITCGIYVDGELHKTSRYFSSRLRTADEYYCLLLPLLDSIGINKVRHIAMASVVPELTRIWSHLFAKYFKASLRVIDAYSPLGLTFKTSDPGFIGSDLVVNAFAAWQKYASNAIVIDLGTATTIQFVTAKGVFEGTSIAPGLKTGAAHLFDSAALLSGIELTAPNALIGTTTRDALLSGIVQGHAFMLDSFINKLKAHYFDHKPILTVLTGGIADLVKPLVPSVDVVDKTLTLDGLWMAHQKLSQAE